MMALRPLIGACFSENLNLIKYLVEHGADTNKGDNNGNTPIILCMSRRT